MTDDRALKLYDEARKKILEDIKSQTADFDRNLLTYSSGALGLSLAFIKDVVPLAKAVWIAALFGSWFAFVLCILITLASFQFSVQAHWKNLDALREYYLEDRQEALDAHLKTLWSRAIDWCTVVASLSFLVGLILTTLFVAVNVWKVRHP